MRRLISTRYASSSQGSLGRGHSRYERGERGRCYNCNSDKHYKYDCDKPDQSDNFTGMVEDAGDKKEDSSFEVFACYEAEAFNKTNIIIDTGATKTVVGEATLKKITMNWDNDSKKKLMIDRSKGGECAVFKFGDERTVKKQRIIHVPVRIGSKIIKLKTYVLPGSVPYLLGMEASRAMKATYLNESTIELLGTKIRGRATNLATSQSISTLNKQTIIAMWYWRSPNKTETLRRKQNS